MIMTSPLSAEDYTSLLAVPCYNSLNYTAYVTPGRIRRMARPLQLRGIVEIEYSKDNASLFLEVIREVLVVDPRIWQAMDMFHDAVAPPPWQYDRATTLETALANLDLTARPLPNDAGTEWSLQWECPTHSRQGEEHWVHILRSTTFVTALGTINLTQAPMVWCGECHSMDHTTLVCPYHEAPGWISSPPPPSAPGGGGAGRGRGRGGGARGFGGRGFGGNRWRQGSRRWSRRPLINT
ncbi:hypothetical protein NMY22_g14256 [Coprinellus aureogranulatus]|nr:hypothetical protein NMY22_g14256 [Coprinellus aureogranulatus]